MSDQVSVIDGSFSHRGEAVAYSVYGSGGRPVVLVHGLLLSRRMQDPLARTLAARGNRVITVDMLGHGESACPTMTESYSIESFGLQVVALLDHLGVRRAVVGGTSLGANIGLEVGAHHAPRVRGLLIEMPVLDNALLAAAAAFTPLCALLTAAPGPVRLATLPARLIPRGALGGIAEVGLEALRRDPDASARVLRGLLFGRTAPTHEQRVRITAPTLVIGHPRDPLHPLSDSDMLARELPDARLVRASSILELRVRPARLTAEIAGFLDSCWNIPSRARRRIA